jgi:hypothetical protein
VLKWSNDSPAGDTGRKVIDGSSRSRPIDTLHTLLAKNATVAEAKEQAARK